MQNNFVSNLLFTLKFLYMYNVSSFVKLHRYALSTSIDYCVPVNILFS